VVVQTLVAEREAEILQRALGERAPMDVRNLLNRYHAHHIKKEAWGKQHIVDQTRYRSLWLEQSEAAPGSPVPFDRLTPAMVEELALEQVGKRGWKSRSHRCRLQYLKSAFSQAMDYDRTIESNPVAKGRLPSLDTGAPRRSYSAKDALLLATPHPDMDWRLTLSANLIVYHGRRIRSITRIGARYPGFPPESNINFADEGVILIRYHGKSDKGNQNTWLPVIEGTQRLTEAVCDRPELRLPLPLGGPRRGFQVCPPPVLEYDRPSSRHRERPGVR